MLSAIDLGSNTLRICVMDEDCNIVSSSEIIVGSARNLKTGGKLDKNAKKRIIKALEKFSLQYNLTKCKAIATEVLEWQAIAMNFLMKFTLNLVLNLKLLVAKLRQN